MSVFTLPSYPYVFKVIKDRIAASQGHRPPARSSRSTRWSSITTASGRMTDILEYSDVAFPRERFSDELLAELHARRAVA